MNRLKLTRKARHMTQAQVAKHLNVVQNTYSGWENGKIRISDEAMRTLASLFGVTIDFLSGREYRMTVPVSAWRKDIQEAYYRATDNEREWLANVYGRLVYDVEADEPAGQNTALWNTDTGFFGANESADVGLLDYIDRELLSVCKKMTKKQKILLLSKAYDMIEDTQRQ